MKQRNFHTSGLFCTSNGLEVYIYFHTHKKNSEYGNHKSSTYVSHVIVRISSWDLLFLCEIFEAGNFDKKKIALYAVCRFNIENFSFVMKCKCLGKISVTR